MAVRFLARLRPRQGAFFMKYGMFGQFHGAELSIHGVDFAERGVFRMERWLLFFAISWQKRHFGAAVRQGFPRMSLTVRCF